MKNKARRYFGYHCNHITARMRSVPACYPNVDLNTTEGWFEIFHFCNLLAFVKPRNLGRNLAAFCKSGRASPQTHSLDWDRWREPPQSAGGLERRRRAEARGLGSPYRNPEAGKPGARAAAPRGMGNASGHLPVEFPKMGREVEGGKFRDFYHHINSTEPGPSQHCALCLEETSQALCLL